MFGVSEHEIISGVVGNSFYAFMVFVFACAVNLVSKKIKNAGIGPTLVRGLWSAFLMFNVLLSLAVTVLLYHGKGFYNGEWFVILCLNAWFYFNRYILFNRNWLEPILDKMIDGVKHIFDMASPDYRSKADISNLIKGMNEDRQGADTVIKKAIKIGPSAVEPLILALHHSQRRVRRNAADALGRIGDSRAVDHLIKCMRDDPEISCRMAAGFALGEIGQPALTALSVAARDHNHDFSHEAISALGGQNNFEATELLVELLKEWRDSSRDEASALLKDCENLFDEHKNLYYSNASREEKSIELKRLLEIGTDIRQRVYTFRDIGRWSTASEIGSALALSAYRAFNVLKSHNRPNP